MKNPRLSLHPSMCFVLVVAHLCRPTLATELETERSTVHIQKMRAVVGLLEAELESVTSLLERQASSKAEVDVVRAELAKARHDLALAENNQAEMVRQCRQLVDVRDRQLRRFMKLASRGFGSQLKLSMANRRLASSRYLLAQLEGNAADALTQLQLVAELCDQELMKMTDLHSDGAASAMELNHSRHRKTIAKYQLARANGDSRSAIPLLRESIELYEQEWDQIKHLKGLGYANVIDVYIAHRHLLNARLLLANLENERSVVLGEFDELFRVHQQIISRLGSNQMEQELRMLIERDLAWDRERKKQFLRDGYLGDDLSIAKLEL